MTKFIQRDNLLTPAYLSRLQQMVSGMNGFPWYFISTDVSYPPGDNFIFGDVALMDCPDEEATIGFTHVLLDQNGQESPWLHHFNALVDHVLDQFPFPVKMLRVRLSLLVNNGKDHHNAAHTDHEDPHTTGLFYFEDATGNTHLFEQFDDPNYGTVDERWLKGKNMMLNHEYTVNRLIKPEANKLVLFPGNQYHASSTPTGKSKYRVTCNFNVVPLNDKHDIFDPTTYEDIGNEAVVH